MKRIVIIAPYFPPSNLVGVHRSRFLASHLKKFGWEPTVLTVKPEYYEEPLDHDLEQLIPPDLKIIRTKAFRTKPIRIVGDISLRCFLWHWTELRSLALRKEIDFIFISLFPAYSTLLGRLIHEEFQIPYGIDYQDPWIEYRQGRAPLFSKTWRSHRLAAVLEPMAVGKVSLLTGVSEAYYEGVVSRNPHLQKVKKVVIPIGIEPSDYAQIPTAKEPYLFQERQGHFNFFYAGALLPEAYAVWRIFFKCLKNLELDNQELFNKIRIICVGTGKKPNDLNDFHIRDLAEEYGLYGKTVLEYPLRIPYLDVLIHLRASDAVLIIGSTEKHYTASKIFQAVFSKKPILAILHSESPALKFLNESRAALAVSFKNHADLNQAEPYLETRIKEIVRDPFDSSKIDYGYFEPFTAEALTRKLVDALDEVIQK